MASRARSLAAHVACEIQPPCNLRTERYLINRMQRGEDEMRSWRQHWITVGFDAIEAQLAEHPATYCVADAPTIADCFLVPQVYNALRPVVGVELNRWPNIERIYARCMDDEAFQRAHPNNQPDFEELTRH